MARLVEDVAAELKRFGVSAERELVEALARALASQEHIVKALWGKNGGPGDVVGIATDTGVLSVEYYRGLGGPLGYEVEGAYRAFRVYWPDIASLVIDWGSSEFIVTGYEGAGEVRVHFSEVDPARFQEFVQWLQDRVADVKSRSTAAGSASSDDAFVAQLERVVALRHRGAVQKWEYKVISIEARDIGDALKKHKEKEAYLDPLVSDWSDRSWKDGFGTVRVRVAWSDRKVWTPIPNCLTELGTQGWELVGITSFNIPVGGGPLIYWMYPDSHLFFKRLM